MVKKGADAQIGRLVRDAGLEAQNDVEMVAETIYFIRDRKGVTWDHWTQVLAGHAGWPSLGPDIGGSRLGGWKFL